MSAQLILSKSGRRRFLKLAPMADFSNWMTYLAEFKSLISDQSGYQIVGRKVYFEMSSKSVAPRMMLEVIGVPAPVDQNAIVMMDLENIDLLVHKQKEVNLFSVDLDQLLLTSWGLKRTLDATFSKRGEELSPFFHIVFNHDKIELHFFRQKDYIQK